VKFTRIALTRGTFWAAPGGLRQQFAVGNKNINTGTNIDQIYKTPKFLAGFASNTSPKSNAMLFITS
jgi:hypothetical protein